MVRKLFLETFGCQMNELDSELVLGQLRALGYEPTDDPAEAGVILYNTCSVREHAEQKVWSRLGLLRDRKAAEPALVIGVIGCMAERDGPGIFTRFPHLDLLCGPGELDKLPGMVHNAVVAAGGMGEDGDGPRVREIEPNETASSGSASGQSGSSDRHRSARLFGRPLRQVALMGDTARRSATLAAAEDKLELLDLSRSVSPADGVRQAYVRITRGCDKFCTYCVVPHTRGPEVHRPPGNILDEVRMLVDAGAREVTLLGQTINHYHHRAVDGRQTSFAELLHRIHEATPDLPRLRFVTSFPRDFGDDALQVMRDCPRICRYLHVPAQSGSDRILKAMNRGYTSGQYRDFIARAREFMPDISLASDFIVGFPTETDDDFRQTLELAGDLRFKNSFIFKYSPRPGTVAIQRFADDVPDAVKRARNQALLAVQQRVSDELNREMIGRTVRVLVEGTSKLVNRAASAGPVASGAVGAASAVGESGVGGSTPGGADPRGPKVELGWERRIALGGSSRSGQEAMESADRDLGRPEAASHVSAASVQLVGRTPGDQVVAFDGDRSLQGQLVDVRIVDARSLTLFAKAVPVDAGVTTS